MADSQRIERIEGSGAFGAIPATVIGPRGLYLPRQMTFQRWINIGMRLSEVATSSAWCLGDWLIYGESAFSGRYRDAIDQTSLDYQTLRNYAWVARRFSPSRRFPELSFGHHAEVAALSDPEQDYWLRKAQQLSWSRNQLRHEVRASLRERKSDEEKKAITPEAEVVLNLSLSQRQKEIYGVAASANGLSLEDWVLNVLENAAQKAIGRGHHLALPVAALRYRTRPGSAAASRKRLQI